MSSESDSTDYEDIEYAPKKGRKSSQSQKGYKIRNALKPPRNTSYSTQALYDQIHSCDIDLEPEYQRDVVWPETKQIGLIDSILRNFYVPPVIFAVNISADGSETRTCIDGKQRLTSIQRFMSGLIPHKDPISSEKYWFIDVGPHEKRSRAKKLLPERLRKIFANKQIACCEYHDILDKDEREIFQRVQLGMALTPAEKLQVISTPRADFIRSLQSTYLKENEGLVGEELDWDRSRGGDFGCLARAVYSIEKFPTQNGTCAISQIEKWLSQSEPFPPTFCQKVHNTFDVFLSLVCDNQFNKVFRHPSRISPVEFVMASLLIAVYKDKLTLGQLSSAIGLMRKDVRNEHVDIRMNGRVGKTVVEFIRNIKPKPTTEDEPAGLAVGRKRKRGDRDRGRDRSSSPETPLISQPRRHLQSQSTHAKNYSPASLSKPNPTQSSAPTSINDRLAPMRAAKAATAPVKHPVPTPTSSHSTSWSTSQTASSATLTLPNTRTAAPARRTLEDSLMSLSSNRSAHPTSAPPERRDYRPPSYTFERQELNSQASHDIDCEHNGNLRQPPPSSNGLNHPPRRRVWGGHK